MINSTEEAYYSAVMQQLSAQLSVQPTKLPMYDVCAIVTATVALSKHGFHVYPRRLKLSAQHPLASVCMQTNRNTVDMRDRPSDNITIGTLWPKFALHKIVVLQHWLFGPLPCHLLLIPTVFNYACIIMPVSWHYAHCRMKIQCWEFVCMCGNEIVVFICRWTYIIRCKHISFISYLHCCSQSLLFANFCVSVSKQVMNVISQHV